MDFLHSMLGHLVCPTIVRFCELVEGKRIEERAEERKRETKSEKWGGREGEEDHSRGAFLIILGEHLLVEANTGDFVVALFSVFLCAPGGPALLAFACAGVFRVALVIFGGGAHAVL